MLRRILQTVTIMLLIGGLHTAAFAGSAGPEPPTLQPFFAPPADGSESVPSVTPTGTFPDTPTVTPTPEPSGATASPTPTGTATPDVTPTPTVTWTPDPVTPTPTVTMETTSTPQPPTPTPAEHCKYVPYQFASIQMALDAAVDGDTVYVAPGEYTGVQNTNLKFRGKAVCLSAFPGEPTPVINCNGSDANPRRGFLFMGEDGPQVRVAGLAVVNGYHYESGAGMRLLSGSAPVIENCFIGNCNSKGFGGGIQAESSGVILSRVRIAGCVSEYGGGGIAFQGSHPTLLPVAYRCEFQDNSCNYSDGGGAVQAMYWAEPVFTGCEFRNNMQSAMALGSDPGSIIDVNNCLFEGNDGGIRVNKGTGSIENCTFSGNLRYAVMGDSRWTDLTLERCCLWGEQDVAVEIQTADYCNMPVCPDADMAGCFHADPIFVEGPMGQYYLYQEHEDEPFSPNVNTGGWPVWMISFPGPGYDVMLQNMTTDAGHMPDQRFSDIGYHYTLSDEEPTPHPPPERPVIEDILGSTEDYTNNAEMKFVITALVSHPGTQATIDTVDLYWESFPTPWQLYDDGTHGDATAGDGRYSRLLSFTGTWLPEYAYRMYVVAADSEGEIGIKMPYVMAVENGLPAPTPCPVIAGRHVWYEPVTPGEDESGLLWILVRVEHPGGLSKIADVRLTYEGADTGLRLLDIGCQADLDAGDGYYGVMIIYNGLSIPEPVEVILGIDAVDVDGHVSTTWPIAWKTQAFVE